jgi:hypothetical protein
MAVDRKAWKRIVEQAKAYRVVTPREERMYARIMQAREIIAEVREE